MTKNQKWLVSLSLVLILFMASCSSMRKGPGQGTFPFGEADLDGASSQEVKEFHSIESLYKQRQYEQVLKKTKAFLAKHPKSAITDQIYFIRGLIFISQKQQQNALINFKQVMAITPNDTIYNMAGYNKALIEFEQGQIEDAKVSLDLVKSSTFPTPSRALYYQLLAKIEKRRGDHIGAVRAVLSAIKFNDSPQLKIFLEENLEKITSEPVIEKIALDYADSSAIDYVYYRLVSLAVKSGDHQLALAYSTKIISQYPSSKFYTSAKERVERNNTNARVRSNRIGVLLTLSGKFGKFGQKTLHGIELAAGVFKKSSDSAESEGPSLVLFDDQGEVETALKGLEELVFQHEVVAVIGPLLSKLSDPVAKRAQELGVPLITLTQKEVLGGDFIFNAALTPAMQVRELVRTMKNKPEIKNVAVLAPSSRFGDEYTKAFWEELKSSDIKVKGIEIYPEGETDFRSYVDSMVGLDQSEARGFETDELKKLMDASQLKVNKKKLNRMFALKPIVDFQAVFIPDDPKSLGQILPTFAYRDIDKVIFLGINTWNSKELLSRTGNYSEGSVFVDAFFPESNLPSAKNFSKLFKDTFNYPAGSLEAMSYDATNILIGLLRVAGISSRDDIRNGLLSLRDFPGVMGSISFIEGKLTKQLPLLTVKAGKIEEIAIY